MRGENRHVGKVTNRGNSANVAIPRPMLFALGLVIGDHVSMRVVEGHIVISPIEAAIRENVDRALCEAGIVRDPVGV